MELRIKGAKEIAEAFAKKRISSKEAADRIYQHEKRWGEALPGTRGTTTSDLSITVPRMVPNSDCPAAAQQRRGGQRRQQNETNRYANRH
jgi:hypothetical protein